MATKDSPVLIFSATDDLVRFWSHSDIGKYRFYANSSKFNGDLERPRLLWALLEKWQILGIQKWRFQCPRPERKQNSFNIQFHIQGAFLNWASPKKLKYGKPRLGESTLT